MCIPNGCICGRQMLTLSPNVTTTDPDPGWDEVRKYVSALWAEDWDSEEDDVY